MASVDVAIPCFNYGRFLPDCVGSVLSQGIDDLRILIIDNASTDDSVEVARRLAADDPRIEVVVHTAQPGAACQLQRRYRLGVCGVFSLIGCG